MGRIVNLGVEKVFEPINGLNYKKLIATDSNGGLNTDVEVLGSGYLKTAIVFVYSQNSGTTPKIKITIDGEVVLWLQSPTGYSSGNNGLGVTSDLFGGYGSLPTTFNVSGANIDVGCLSVSTMAFPLDTLQTSSGLGPVFNVEPLRFETSLKIESYRQAANTNRTYIEYYLD